MSDRIAVLDRGHVVEVGTPSGLYAAPRSAFLATFLGQANLLPVTLVTPSGAAWMVESAWGPFEVPRANMSPDVAAQSGTRALSVIRPEHLSIGLGDTAPGLRPITATVTQALFNGSETVYRGTCEGSGIMLTLRENRPGQSVYAVGGTIPLSVDFSFAMLVPLPRRDETT